MSHEALSGHTCNLPFLSFSHHMVFDCPALEEVRVQHAGLFAGSADLRSFLAQESSQVAALVSAGFDARRKEDYMYALAKPHGPCRGPQREQHAQKKSKTKTKT